MEELIECIKECVKRVIGGLLEATKIVWIALVLVAVTIELSALKNNENMDFTYIKYVIYAFAAYIILKILNGIVRSKEEPIEEIVERTEAEYPDNENGWQSK